MSFLQMSFSGAVLIAVIAAVRAAALDKLPKSTFLVLWWVAILRLSLPFSLPAAFSVYSLAERQLSGIEERMSLATTDFVPVQAEKGTDEGRSPFAGEETVWTVSAPAGGNLPVLPAVWFAGTVVCLLFFAGMYVRCLLEFRTSLPVENAFVSRWLSGHRLKRPLSVRQSDRIRAPLTYGILRPVILMPKNMDWEDEQKLSYILLHEYIHIRRFDAAAKLAAAGVLCVHWFNPMVWLMAVLFGRDMELACDERVVLRYGQEARASYALTLICMEEKKSGMSVLGSSFSRNAIEERIRSIMKIKRMSVLAVLSAVFVVGGVSAVFATTAAEPPEVQEESVAGEKSWSPVSRVDFQEDGPLLAEYENYGVSYDEAGKMYLDGKRVRYFLDGHEIRDYGDDGASVVIGWGVRFEYLDRDGVVDARVLRRVEKNPDGSDNPAGAVIGIRPCSQEEFDALDVDALLRPENRAASVEEELSEGRGEEVTEGRAVSAAEELSEGRGEEVTESLAVSAEDTAELQPGGKTETETVEADAAEDISGTAARAESVSEDTVAESTDKTGETIGEYFRRFAPYGIIYEQRAGAENGSAPSDDHVYYNGKPVKHFADIGPEGTRTFEFAPGSEDGLTVMTVYDEDGSLAGLVLPE